MRPSSQVDQASATQKRSEVRIRFPVHFHERWQLAFAPVVNKPDPLRPGVVLYHFKVRGHGCWFPLPVQWAPSVMELAASNTATLHRTREMTADFSQAINWYTYWKAYSMPKTNNTINEVAKYFFSAHFTWKPLTTRIRLGRVKRPLRFSKRTEVLTTFVASRSECLTECRACRG